MKRTSFVAVTMLTVGCGGGGSGGSGGAVAACASISGGTSSVTSTGPASNTSAAVDGDLFSHATLALTSSSQSGSIRATAQSGVVFPAGSRAGVFASLLNQGTANVTMIRTYLNGALVESRSPANAIFEQPNGDTGAGLYIGLVTTAPFDAVEFAETDNGANGTTDYRVYEICSDGKALAPSAIANTPATSLTKVK